MMASYQLQVLKTMGPGTPANSCGVTIFHVPHHPAYILGTTGPSLPSCPIIAFWPLHSCLRPHPTCAFVICQRPTPMSALPEAFLAAAPETSAFPPALCSSLYASSQLGISNRGRRNYFPFKFSVALTWLWVQRWLSMSTWFIDFLKLSRVLLNSSVGSRSLKAHELCQHPSIFFCRKQCMKALKDQTEMALSPNSTTPWRCGLRHNT